MVLGQEDVSNSRSCIAHFLIDSRLTVSQFILKYGIRTEIKTRGSLNGARGYVNGLHVNWWLEDRNPDVVLSFKAHPTRSQCRAKGMRAARFRHRGSI